MQGFNRLTADRLDRLFFNDTNSNNSLTSLPIDKCYWMQNNDSDL